MTNRERVKAILNYEEFDRMPIAHFSFWEETLIKWKNEGYLTGEEIIGGCLDGSASEQCIAKKLGFDFNWSNTLGANTGLHPTFETKVIEELEDGFRKVLSSDGVIILQKDDAISIPAEVDYLLKGRPEWEQYYLPKLKFSEDRISRQKFECLKNDQNRENPIGLHCGSLFGQIRNWLTLKGASYLYADDEDLFSEIIDIAGDISYRCTEKILSSGAKFDFAHFWEDICFKNGPLINPSVFEKKVGPHYKRITDLVKSYGINIISVDCDGLIDSLIPIWLNNGVNTMFPIEVGTWNGNILPWRNKYGKDLRGVGGMNKNVFARNYSDIDAEIERLKPLVDLGGYIPCVDHRIAPDAKWENVQYYCDKMRKTFGD